MMISGLMLVVIVISWSIADSRSLESERGAEDRWLGARRCAVAVVLRSDRVVGRSDCDPPGIVVVKCVNRVQHFPDIRAIDDGIFAHTARRNACYRVEGTQNANSLHPRPDRRPTVGLARIVVSRNIAQARLVRWGEASARTAFERRIAP